MKRFVLPALAIAIGLVLVVVDRTWRPGEPRLAYPFDNFSRFCPPGKAWIYTPNEGYHCDDHQSP